MQRLLKRLFRCTKGSPNTSTWFAYTNADNEYKQAIARAKDDFYCSTLPTLLRDNPRKFWCTVNSKNETLIELCDTGGIPVNNKDCCDILNNAFISFFSHNHVVYTDYPDSGFSPMYTIVFD